MSLWILYCARNYFRFRMHRGERLAVERSKPGSRRRRRRLTRSPRRPLACALKPGQNRGMGPQRHLM